MLGHLINDFDFSSFYVSFWPTLGSWYLKASQSLLQGLLKSICILLSPLCHCISLLFVLWVGKSHWLESGQWQDFEVLFWSISHCRAPWDLGGFHTLWTKQSSKWNQWEEKEEIRPLQTALTGQYSSTCRWKIWFSKSYNCQVFWVYANNKILCGRQALEMTGVLPNSVVILDMTSLLYQDVYLHREGFVRCSPLSLFLLALWARTIPYA